MKDFIIKMVPPAAYNALKDKKVYELIIQLFKINFSELYELIHLAYEYRFQGINAGVELRSRNEDKVKYLDKNIKKSLKIIDAECFRVGLIPRLGKSLEEIFEDVNGQINLIKFFPKSLKSSLEELQKIFNKSFDKIITPNYRLHAGLSENNSEDFNFISEILNTDFNNVSVIEDDNLKSNMMKLSSNMLKLYIVVMFELAYYQKMVNLRKTFDETSVIINDGSSLSLEERKSIVTEELAFMAGKDKFGQSIMLDNDFKRMINFTEELVTSNKFPTIERKIPATNTTMEKIRYAYYIINKRIYSRKSNKARFIDFLHAAFEQFTCEKSTTEKKFSMRPH